ncbi:hypothetical protein DVS28_b0161 (plasmid) [Euzebya pacifica]|uniref:Uncharacterized protein n=1 Tax=Euzebya pacifica TaxID=1608957 RepID=A0A346Y634_9ACTN|nr:hypothetical protein [Euzebya pacifica]AXV09931.1 hypothetical protein DVS28_b0161 [Euzebya pacifica]
MTITVSPVQTTGESDRLQTAFQAVHDAERAALAVIEASLRAACNRVLPHLEAVIVDSLEDDCAGTVNGTDQPTAHLPEADRDTVEALNEALWAEMSSLHPHADDQGLIRIGPTDA